MNRRWTPAVTKESHNGTNEIQLYSELLSNRNIFLQGAIKLYCTGIAASMAAIIPAGGQKGNRYILPHSKVMIHEPLIAGGVGGSATSIKNIADSILQTRKLVNEILSKHTGKTIGEIEESTSFDNYLNAEEAVKFGLCDQIIPGFIQHRTIPVTL
ncbi:MAG: ClpP family protease [Acetatifactor sp.]